RLLPAVIQRIEPGIALPCRFEYHHWSPGIPAVIEQRSNRKHVEYNEAKAGLASGGPRQRCFRCLTFRPSRKWHLLRHGASLENESDRGRVQVRQSSSLAGV